MIYSQWWLKRGGLKRGRPRRTSAAAVKRGIPHQCRWRKNCSTAGSQPGYRHLDWGIPLKLCVPSLFKSLYYTVRTNGATRGRKNSFLSYIIVVHIVMKKIGKTSWIWAMVVQKTICWPILAAPSGMPHAASTVRQTQATAAARWRNTTPRPAALLLYGRAGRLSLFLLCFSFTHTPYYMPEH